MSGNREKEQKQFLAVAPPSLCLLLSSPPPFYARSLDYRVNVNVIQTVAGSFLRRFLSDLPNVQWFKPVRVFSSMQICFPVFVDLFGQDKQSSTLDVKVS